MPRNRWERVKGISARLNSPILVSLSVGMLYIIFLYFQLIKYDNDWSVFVTAGEGLTDSTVAPEGLRVLRDSAGYDGQFYYRLALTPFTNEQTDFGITLDHPRYRQQRIVYPLLAKVFSLGQIDLVPFSLVMVNFLALCAIGWLGARYSLTKVGHAFWGFAFALYPGFLLSLSRDTTEIVAACFMLACILSLTLKREFLAGVMLILAILTKESSLVLAIGILIAAVIDKAQWKSRRVLIAIGSILAYAIWQAWLAFKWSISLLSIGVSANLGLPFDGIARFLPTILPPHEYRHVVWLIELLLIMGIGLVVLRAFRNSRAEPFIKISWLFYALLMVSASRAIWAEDWSFVRVFFEFWIFSILIILESAIRIKNWMLGLSTSSWLLLAIDVVRTR